MSNLFNLEEFDKKPDTNIEEFDFFNVDKNQHDFDKHNSFFSNKSGEIGKNDFSLGDFGQPDAFSQDKHSKTSQIFKFQKPQSNNVIDDVNRSRHLQDISFTDNRGSTDNKFVYSKPMPSRQQSNDQSFERLNRLVKQPKPKDLNEFFQELSQSNKQQPNQSFMKRDKYSNREEFEQYLKNLKFQKRMAQEKHQTEVQMKARQEPFRKASNYSPFEPPVTTTQPTYANQYHSATSFESNNSKSRNDRNNNYQQKQSQNRPIDYNSESDTNKSNEQDLKRGQYLNFDKKPEVQKEDPFSQFDFGGLQHSNSFKKGFESPRPSAKQSHQFGQGSDFFQDKGESQPGIGSLQLKSNMGSKKYFDGPSQKQFDAPSQRKINQLDPHVQRTSVQSIEVDAIRQPVRQPSRQSTKAIKVVPTNDQPVRSIQQPPKFDMLLQEDMLNPNFDEKVVPQSPKEQPASPINQATAPVQKLKSSQNIAPPKSNVKLTTIREQNSNIFQKTVEEEKLTKLFQNYEKLKQNFDALMNELKSNTEGQQMIMSELASLKQQYKESEDIKIQQIEQQRRLRTAAIDDKQLKILELKKQLQIIKSQERNNIEKQICDRIASLEQIVKKSFEDMNTDKKECMVWVNPENSQARSKSPQINPHNQEDHADRFSERASDENMFTGSRNTLKNNLKQSVIQEIYSPLQLRLDNYQNTNLSPPEKLQESRRVQSFDFNRILSPKRYTEGENYKPKVERIDQYFKLACMQQQAVIYESFDFLVNCRYSMIKSNNRKVVKINVSIRNKTILTLMDLIVIVYGSVGEALSVNPAKIYAQRLQPDDLMSFEVYLSNIVLDNQHINMQMSYKSETLSKKKIQVRVPRPIIKFFDIQFTHQDQFKTIWKGIAKELYVEAKLLNFKVIKSSEDLKVILPFVELSEQDDQEFSYGILLTLFNIEGLLLFKLLCSTDGRASMHIRFERDQSRPYAEQILDTMNSILFN